MIRRNRTPTNHHSTPPALDHHLCSTTISPPTTALSSPAATMARTRTLAGTSAVIPDPTSWPPWAPGPTPSPIPGILTRTTISIWDRISLAARITAQTSTISTMMVLMMAASSQRRERGDRHVISPREIRDEVCVCSKYSFAASLKFEESSAYPLFIFAQSLLIFFPPSFFRARGGEFLTS